MNREEAEAEIQRLISEASDNLQLKDSFAKFFMQIQEHPIEGMTVKEVRECMLKHLAAKFPPQKQN